MKNPILKIIIITIILTAPNKYLLSQESQSQSKDTLKENRKVQNSLKSSLWAIQFGIGSNFTLTNFDDALFAVKRHFSKYSALRLDFNFNYVNVENKSPEYTLEQDDSYGGNLSFLYYINPNEQFNIYFVLGVNYSYQHSFYNYRSEPYYYETRSWSVGPRAGIGSEYFIFKRMSLFAEYNFTLGFGKKKETSDQHNSSNIDANVTSLTKESVKFGLSVYFQLF